MGNKYEKNTGYADGEGVKFQQNLVILCCLNGYVHHKDWKVSSENKNAGKFDDVVMELTNGTTYLVQAKHKKNEKACITKKQFLSTNKNAQFSLPKYFFSYEGIKNKLGEETIVICTNASVDTEDLKGILTQYQIDHKNILHYERVTGSGSFFKFNKNILSELKECLEVYFNDYLKDGDTDRMIITEENLKDFLKKLQVFSSYPSGNDLENIIDGLLSSLKYSVQISHHDIHKKVDEWFKKQKGEYLTKSRVNAMLCEIKSDKYWESLKKYKVSFEHNEFNFTESSKIVHVKTDEAYLLQIIKIHDALKNYKRKKLFVNSDDDIEALKQNVEAFELRHYTYLVIVSMKSQKKIAVNEIVKLREILETYPHKKVVLVAKSGNKLAQYIGLNVFQVNGSVKFQDLSKDTQKNLLNKDVVFQGKEVKLDKLLRTEAAEDYTKSLDSRLLTELVKGTVIEVGIQPLDLDKDVIPYYIPRAFERNTHEKEKMVIPEERFYSISEKVVLISDSAGMGKSTVLKKLAAHITEHHSHLWIIRINLNDYTAILREKGNKHKINVLELLNSRETTRITNPFEKFVFSMREKVVLMCDGVDEISPDYTGLIVGLLGQCQEASNFSKIFVTTRPHVTSKLELILRATSFKMVPFSRSNQIDFLANYWSHNLQLDSTNKNKCKQYAEVLIDKMSSWIKSIHFAAIPMQANILAKIFQENIHKGCMDWRGCKEYLEGNTAEPQLPDTFNIAELYEMFIGKKQEVFVDKGSSGGNIAARQALANEFDGYLVYHRSLALKLLLTEEEANLFKTCLPKVKDAKEYVLNIGIVQRFGEELKFIHRTFAEYFVAESIIYELKRQTANAEFKKMLIDKILVDDSFEIVCVFLDILLQKEPLSSNILKDYQSFVCKSNQNLIFHLARQGYVTILQLILKCINFTIVRGQEICISDWRVKIWYKKRNTLNDLEVLTRKAGINIKHTDGNTPLHFAVRGGHLEMISFLVEKGADVCCKNRQGSTAPHLAAELGMFHIIKYFVEVDPNVNIVKDDMGRTLLHLAAGNNRLNIVKLLVEREKNLEGEDSAGCTALHLAAKWGRLNIVDYLVHKGASLKTVDHRGRSPVHSAAKWAHLTTLEYLMKHDAVFDAKDKKGCAAIHLAAKSGPLNTLTYLLEQGASVNVADGEGRTPLHVAAENGRLNIVKLLVKHKADVTIRNNKDRTALDLAAEKDNLTIVNFLGNINSPVSDN